MSLSKTGIVAHFIVARLTGAGFALVLFAGVSLVVTRFDWVEFANNDGWLVLWFIFYGYGVACSIVIDLLARLIRTKRISIGVLVALYFIAGFAFFQVKGMDIFTIVAGLFGAVSALVFYAGTVLAGTSRSFRLVFALIAPLAMLLVIQFDYTSKKGWNEVVTDSSFEVSADYFHGRHEIPIYMDQGQDMKFSLIFRQGSGGYGYHVLDARNRKVPYERVGTNQYLLHAKRSEIYRIVVTGSKFRGSVKINWDIVTPKLEEITD